MEKIKVNCCIQDAAHPIQVHRFPVHVTGAYLNREESRYELWLHMPDGRTVRFGACKTDLPKEIVTRWHNQAMNTIMQKLAAAQVGKMSPAQKKKLLATLEGQFSRN